MALRRLVRSTKLNVLIILIVGLVLTAAYNILSFLKTSHCRDDEMKENFKYLVSVNWLIACTVNYFEKARNWYDFHIRKIVNFIEQ